MQTITVNVSMLTYPVLCVDFTVLTFQYLGTQPLPTLSMGTNFLNDEEFSIIATYTSDIAQPGTFPYQLKVSYNGSQESAKTYQFNVIIVACPLEAIKTTPEIPISVDYVTTTPDLDIGYYHFEQLFLCDYAWPDYPDTETVISMPSFVTRDETTKHFIINCFDDNSLDGTHVFFIMYEVDWADETGPQKFL